MDSPRTTVRLSATAMKSLQRAGLPAAPIPDLPDASETASLIPAKHWPRQLPKELRKAEVPERWDTEGDA